MDISEILTAGNVNIGEHYQIRGIYGVDALETVLEWYHPSVPYPTAQQLATWQALAQTKLDAAAAFLAAKAGLREKIALAQTHAANITILWNLCLTQVENNTAHPTKYNNVRTFVDALPAALRNRLHNGVNLVAIDTDDEREAYFEHILSYSTALGMLLSLG